MFTFIDISISETQWIIWSPWGLSDFSTDHKTMTVWPAAMTKDLKGFIVQLYIKCVVSYRPFLNLSSFVWSRTLAAPHRACWGGSGSCDTFLGVFTCQQLAWGWGELLSVYILALSVWSVRGIYLTSEQPIADCHTHTQLLLWLRGQSPHATNRRAGGQAGKVRTFPRQPAAMTTPKVQPWRPYLGGEAGTQEKSGCHMLCEWVRTPEACEQLWLHWSNDRSIYGVTKQKWKPEFIYRSHYSAFISLINVL